MVLLRMMYEVAFFFMKEICFVTVKFVVVELLFMFVVGRDYLYLGGFCF